jgi:hypothetical protein
MYRFAVLILVLVASAAGPGCPSLRVKLSARTFARALRRGDRPAVMRASTAGLNRAFWAKLDPDTFKTMVQTFKGGFAGSSSSGKKGRRRKKRSRVKARVVGLELKGKRARLRIRLGGVRVDFLMAKTRRSWKVDDLQLVMEKNVLSLRKDSSLWLSIQGFYAATSAGNRKRLMRYSSGDFNRRAWTQVTDAQVRRTSRSVNLKSSGGGSSGGKKTRFGLKLGHRSARFDVRSGTKRAVFYLVREGTGWRVDDVQLSRTVSGKKKMGSMKELVATLVALRRFLRALKKRDLKRIRAMASSRSGRDIWAKAKREHVVPIFPPKRARLVSWDVEGRRATLVLSDPRKRSRGLTAWLIRENGRWGVADLLLVQGSDRIRLGQAVAIRKVLTRVLRATMNGRLDRVRQLSSEDLNRKVWNRLRSFGVLKAVLLMGGLNKLLGFKVMPTSGLWARLNFIRRASAAARNLLRGRVKVAGGGVRNGKAKVRLRLFGKVVTLRLVKESGGWKLDDVIWPTPFGRRSLKTAAGDVLGLIPAK